MERIDRGAARLFGDELPAQQFGDIVGPGPAHDVGAVHLDRARAEIELPRDRLVAQPRRDRVEDAALARGQRGQSRFGVAVPVEDGSLRRPRIQHGIDRPPDGARIERRGQQVVRAAAQDRARFGDAQPLGGDKGGDVTAPCDPFEQCRAVDPARLVPVEQQDAPRLVGFGPGVDPVVGAGKAAHDPRGIGRQRAKTRRALGPVWQDQMDRASGVGHAAVLPRPGGGDQRLPVGGGAVTERTRRACRDRCHQPAMIAAAAGP